MLKSKPFWIILLYVTITIVLFVGCKGQFPNKKTPIENQYQNNDCNNAIELVRVKSVLEKDSRISGIEVVTIGKDLYLDLENHSNRTIQFPPDGGSVYFIFDREVNEWVIIENSWTNLNTDPELLLPKDSPDYLSGFYSITPNIPRELGSKELTPFRVVVVGNFVSSIGEVQEIVCATYDLLFEPPNFD